MECYINAQDLTTNIDIVFFCKQLHCGEILTVIFSYDKQIIGFFMAITGSMHTAQYYYVQYHSFIVCYIYIT